MKKHLSWILFIAAVLSLSMLFAACDSGENDTEVPSSSEQTEEITTETPTERETEGAPIDEVIDYSALIDEWEAYFTYAQEKQDGKFTSAEALFDGYDKLGVGTVTRNPLSDNVMAVETVSGANRLFKSTVYNLETGKTVVSDLSEVYSTLYGGKTRTFTYDLVYGTIIEVEWTIRENKGTIDAPNWETSVMYSYYDVNNSLIASNVKERASRYYEDLVDSNQDGYADYTNGCLKINGTNYYCKNREIAFTTTDIYPYQIPEYIGNSGYEKIGEYNGFIYYCNGFEIEMFDTQTYRVYELETPIYIDVQDMYILSDGRVYITYTELASGDDYSYESNGIRTSVYHYIADPVSGEFDEAELGFVVNSLYSNENAHRLNASINGEYQYAEIVKFADGKLENEKCYAILDASLNIVAELPCVLKNQMSFYGMIGNGVFVFNTRDAYYSTVRYTVNGDTGTVEIGDKTLQSPVISAAEGVFKMNNGYAVLNIINYPNYGSMLEIDIYNSDIDKVKTLKREDIVDIYGGNILIELKSTEEVIYTETENEKDFVQEIVETSEITEYQVGYVDSDGEFETNTIYKGDGAADYFYDGSSCGYYVVRDSSEKVVEIYNSFGEHLNTIFDVNSVSVYATFENSVIIEVGSDAGSSYYIIK